MNLNKVILGGRLVANPELKNTQNGVAVTTFTIAVDSKYQKDGEKKADFITVVAWRQTAEFIRKYFLKGSAIIVCGSIQTRSWTDNNGNKRYATEVVASEVSFAETKKASDNISITREESASESFVEVEDEDGLPF